MGTIIGKTVAHTLTRLHFYGSYDEAAKVAIISGGRNCKDNKISFNPDAKIVEKIINELPSTKLAGDIEVWYNNEIAKQEMINEILDKGDYFKSGLEFMIRKGRCIVNDSPLLPVEELISRYVNRWERVLFIVPDWKKDYWLLELGLLREDVISPTKNDVEELICKKEVVAVLSFKQTENPEYIFLIRSVFDVVVIDGCEYFNDYKDPMYNIAKSLGIYNERIVLIDGRQKYNDDDYIKSLFLQLNIINPKKYSSLKGLKRTITTRNELDQFKLVNYLQQEILQRKDYEFPKYLSLKHIQSKVKIPKWLQTIISKEGGKDLEYDKNIITFPMGEGFEIFDGFHRKLLEICRYTVNYKGKTCIVVRNPKFHRYLTETIRRVYEGSIIVQSGFPDGITMELIKQFNTNKNGILLIAANLYKYVITDNTIFVDVIDVEDYFKKEGFYIEIC